MATTTQHNPNATLNTRLNQAGASKTIYALVTPETEATKAALLGNADQAGVDPARATYLEQFRDAWTSKQDALHEVFFDTWHASSQPLVDLDRGLYPFAYPTAGAREPLRHLIYAYGNMARRDGFVPRVHVFKGEYEGYKAYAEAALIAVVEHDRRDWRQVAETLPDTEWLFLSQPSAIDGMPGKRASLTWLDYESHDSKRRRLFQSILASSVDAMSAELEGTDLKPSDLQWIVQGLLAHCRTDDAKRLRARAKKHEAG